MQQSSSPTTSQTPFKPLMLSIPGSDAVDPKSKKLESVEDSRTWSDRMREIDQLEEPERWDGMS